MAKKRFPKKATTGKKFQFVLPRKTLMHWAAKLKFLRVTPSGREIVKLRSTKFVDSTRIFVFKEIGCSYKFKSPTAPA